MPHKTLKRLAQYTARLAVSGASQAAVNHNFAVSVQQLLPKVPKKLVLGIVCVDVFETVLIGQTGMMSYRRPDQAEKQNISRRKACV